MAMRAAGDGASGRGARVARREGSGRRVRPRVEVLESRGLMTVTLHSFPIPEDQYLEPVFANQITAGPDGGLWYSLSAAASDIPANAVGRIDAKTHATTNIPLPSTPTPGGDLSTVTSAGGIAAGSDGGIWFLGEKGDFLNLPSLVSIIGRVDPKTHAVAVYQIPPGAASLGTLTSGPDGALWFTSYSTNQIGRFDPKTHVTAEYTIPTAGSRPTGITSGPDGALWFTEARADQIGRIDPKTHVITEFRLPTANAGPDAITEGPDHALWFTEDNAEKVGRIDPTTHAVAEYHVATSPALLSGITTGADGNLWFTVGGYGIGRIVPTTHAVTLFRQASAGFTPSSIASGADGNLWFANFGEIGQAVLTPSPPVATPPAVVSLKRYGVHRQPTTLVLAFSTPLDPARAEDAGNYRIIAPDGRTIAVDSASYDPGTRTVSLRPHQALDVHRRYRLIVTGTGPRGVAGPTGVLLDGAGNGRAGSDYVATVDRGTLVLPGRPARA